MNAHWITRVRAALRATLAGAQPGPPRPARTVPTFWAAMLATIAMTGCPMLQDQLMFYPTRVRAEDVAQVRRAADRPSVRVRDWFVEGEWWGFIAEPREGTADAARPTALVFHGNAGWAGDRLYYVAPLVSRGYRVVLVEYPGYGLRPGRATVETVLEAAERTLEEAKRTWSAPLVLIGESLGAGVIAQLARRHESRLAGLVLITPWDTLWTVAKAHFSWLPVSWFLKHPMDSVAALASFAKPITVMVADRDEIVGATGGLALAKALEVARLVVLPNAGHNDWLGVMGAAHWDALLAPMATARP